MTNEKAKRHKENVKNHFFANLFLIFSNSCNKYNQPHAKHGVEEYTESIQLHVFEHNLVIEI